MPSIKLLTHVYQRSLTINQLFLTQIILKVIALKITLDADRTVSVVIKNMINVHYNNIYNKKR